MTHIHTPSSMADAVKRKAKPENLRKERKNASYSYENKTKVIIGTWLNICKAKYTHTYTAQDTNNAEHGFRNI